jgi:uncharacterized membrane protein
MFGIPWIVFAIQHYMYADFVKFLVPAYMPWRLFWAYFTGTAMLTAGLSFIIRKQVQLAAFLLGCLMIFYLLMVHPTLIIPEPLVGKHWTRFFQDITIMSAAFGLAIVSERMEVGTIVQNWGRDAVSLKGWRAWLASPRARILVRYGYALPFIVLGAQHFTHNVFVTGKVPDWAPFLHFWDYVVGLALVFAACGMLFTSKKRWTAGALGTILTALAILQHLPLLLKDPHNAGEWTESLIETAVAAGAFIIAETMDR